MTAPEIGRRKQLFLDDGLVAERRGLERLLHPPQRRQIVLESAAPWESYRVLLTSAVDTGAGLRLYYQALARDRGGRLHASLCVAESQDGVGWTRPRLGLHAWDGDRGTNIVAPHLGGAPHYDAAAPLGAPWTMIGAVSGLAHPEGLKPPSELSAPLSAWRDPVYGLAPNAPALLTSEDGRRWQVRVPELLPFALDCWTNQLLFDPRLGRYVAYLRGFPGRRTVHRYETDDPRRVPWARPRAGAVADGYGSVYLTDELPVALDVDGGDHWQGDVQNPAVVPYPWAQDAYLAFPSLHRWYPGPSARGHESGAAHRFRFFNDGLDEIHLFASRDGITWQRPSRAAYVPLGVWGDWDGGSVFSGVGLVRRGDELWQYWTGLRRTHGAVVAGDRNVGRICRTVQRLDGFVSLTAGSEPGELRTVPLRFDGDRLELNLDGGALGEARVELQAADGSPVPGYALEDCDPVDRNQVRAPVSWGGRTDVAGLRGRPVRLRLQLTLGHLYAFQFREAGDDD